MIRNYFTIAYRNLLNQKAFSFINIVGLAIGMTCCLLIFQYVAFEYSFDKFHNHQHNIYRVLQAFAQKGEELGTGHSYTPQALAPSLKDIPEIQYISRVTSDAAIVVNTSRPNKVFEENAILYVDSSFLKIFTFPSVSGINTLTSGMALITERTAKKYFGSDNPQGQVLEITSDEKRSFTIAGVLKNVPDNSHLNFEILLPMEDLLKGNDYANEPEGGWSWNNFVTYLKVNDGAEVATVEKKITNVVLQYRGEALRQRGYSTAMQVQPLSDIHLNSEIESAGNLVSGSYRTVYFFLVVGVITLIIALVNYVNLATARAVNRSREVGVRKAVGAARKQLIGQFLFESAITNFTAAILALALATAMIPFVNDLAETHLSISLWLDRGFLVGFISVLLVATLSAGMYPAFVLSSFKPASVLKGKGSSTTSHPWLRRGLVVVQFSASIVLIAGTLTVYKQLNYMRNMDLGLVLDKIVTVRSPRVLPENAQRTTLMQTFKSEVKTLPGVDKVALSSTVPGSGFNWNGAAIRKSTDDPSMAIRGVATWIDSTFASTYGLKLVAGQDFKNVSVDTSVWQVIVNETTVKSLGFNAPYDAIGQNLDVGGTAARIIGVYKDFNWTSAHQARQNIIFGQTNGGQYISLRLMTPDIAGVMKQIEKVYMQMFPENVFQYQFADQSFNAQYREEQRFAKLFSISAGMTIFIACLGLFGLVAFTAQQRTKEIGMRKVLGASVTGIVGLLSKDFLKLVFIGYCIAVPVTWYAMNQWLENFAYRTAITLDVYLVAGVAALLIALLTVSWQSFKAAIANPINSLRSE